jgi:hypothetical protein
VAANSRKKTAYAFESLDGKRVLYSKYQEPGIWSVPAEGGEERQVLEKARARQAHLQSPNFLGSGLLSLRPSGLVLLRP